MGAGATVGLTLKRVITKEEDRNTLTFDALDAAGTAVLWPVALPIQAVVITDGLVNGASWKISVRRRIKVKD